jgi:MSHA biogenesis protein MshQ
LSRIRHNCWRSRNSRKKAGRFHLLNAIEGRSGGPGFRTDSVAVRGSGSLLTGYPYLGGTNPLTPGIDDTTSATPSFGHAYRIAVDARCYQLNTANADINCNNAALAKRAQVTVNRDASGAGTFNASNQIVNFDAYAANSAQANVPANWKLSFTGSTGSATNFHEIQGIKVCAQVITPPAGYGIQVDKFNPSTCGTPGGSPSSPIVTVTARDSNGNTVTNYAKTIALSATLPGGGASTPTWRKVGAGANLPGNQYTFTLADNGVAQFYLTNANTQSVYITIAEVSDTLASSLAAPVQFSGGFFVVANTDSLQGNPGGGLVAGRSHLMA